MGLNSFSNWPRSSLGQIGTIKLQFVTNFSNFDLFTAALGFPFMHIASRIIQNHQCVYGLTHTHSLRTAMPNWIVVVGKSWANTETPCWLTYPPTSEPLSLYFSRSLGVWWTGIFPRGLSFQPPDYYLWTELSQLATCIGEIQHMHTL